MKCDRPGVLADSFPGVKPTRPTSLCGPRSCGRPRPFSALLWRRSPGPQAVGRPGAAGSRQRVEHVGRKARAALQHRHDGIIPGPAAHRPRARSFIAAGPGDGQGHVVRGCQARGSVQLYQLGPAGNPENAVEIGGAVIAGIGPLARRGFMPAKVTSSGAQVVLPSLRVRAEAPPASVRVVRAAATTAADIVSILMIPTHQRHRSEMPCFERPHLDHERPI